MKEFEREVDKSLDYEEEIRLSELEKEELAKKQQLKKRAYQKKNTSTYVFSYGRENKPYCIQLYGDNNAYCRKMAVEKGLEKEPNQYCLKTYLNYLIDKDRKENGDTFSDIDHEKYSDIRFEL